MRGLLLDSSPCPAATRAPARVHPRGVPVLPSLLGQRSHRGAGGQQYAPAWWKCLHMDDNIHITYTDTHILPPISQILFVLPVAMHLGGVVLASKLGMLAQEVIVSLAGKFTSCSFALRSTSIQSPTHRLSILEHTQHLPHPCLAPGLANPHTDVFAHTLTHRRYATRIHTQSGPFPRQRLGHRFGSAAASLARRMTT